jgi:hypothetical protein
MRRILILLCAISLSCAGMAGVAPLDLARAADDMPLIPKAWLDKKVTIAEAEAGHPGISDERVQRFPDAAKPFGFKSGQWEAIKAAMQPGDELWTFASPAESWENLAGRAGITVVRDGNPIMVLTTMLN